MALPTRHEQLRIAALNALRHGELEEIDRHLAAALKDGACEPDLVTEEPECKTALLRAVERADLERVSRYVLEFGCSLAFENRNGDTPLSEAIKIGNKAVVSHLLEMGAELDHVNAMGESALTHILRCCRYESLPNQVRWLLDHPRAPFPRPADLTEAIILGHHQIIILLLEYHAGRVGSARKRREKRDAAAAAARALRDEETAAAVETDQTRESGEEALTETALAASAGAGAGSNKTDESTDSSSASFGSLQTHRTAPTLDERRSSLNRSSALGGGLPAHMQKGEGSDEALLGMPKSLLETVDPTYGRTPLMCAASSGAAGTVALLLGMFGADPNAQSPAGHTALTIASFHGHDDTVRALVNGGADVDFETSMGHTALLQCCLAGHAQTARVLCVAGADVDRQNGSAETALTTACRAGRASAVMALLTKGANVNYETRSGRTALHEAMRCDRPKVVETLLLDAALNVNRMPASSAKLRSPLMIGVANGSDRALSVLLQKNVINPLDENKIGLDLHLETPLGETALVVSIAEGTASSGLLVIRAMIRQVATENGESSTQFQAAVLSARMLLSGLQRMLSKAEEKSNALVANRAKTELCQRAQTVVEAMQEGVRDTKEMIKELAVEHHRMAAESSEAKGDGKRVDLQAAIDAARWTQ